MSRAVAVITCVFIAVMVVGYVHHRFNQGSAKESKIPISSDGSHVSQFVIRGVNFVVVDAVLRSFPYYTPLNHIDQRVADIRVPVFAISQKEITFRQYWEFCVAEGLPRYYGLASLVDNLVNNSILLDRPVVGVSWDAARRYANWLGGDLPTEDQWYASLVGDSYPDAVMSMVRKKMDSLKPGYTEAMDGLFPRSADNDVSSVGVFGLLSGVSEWILAPWGENGSDGTACRVRPFCGANARGIGGWLIASGSVQWARSTPASSMGEFTESVPVGIRVALRDK